MLGLDSIREIFTTISKNKLRTTLTGLAVAWGIFMLIILLAAGNGLKNGVQSNFASRAQNAVGLWPGWTSMPHNGLPSNRKIRFDDRDYDLIKNKVPGVEYVSPRIGQTVTLSYGEEYGTWRLDGVSPDVMYINNLNVKSGNGRFVNQMDVKNRRKVIVVSTEMRDILFKGADPLGKYVNANNLAYQVIGVYENTSQGQNNPPAYIPFTTAQTLYNQGWGFHQIDFTINGLKTVEENEAFVEELRERFSKIHSFDPQDRSALYIRNQAEMVEQSEDLFNTINLFILIIGVCSLMAGIVGVGNIMIITVKERTREIGIRKAIGATPSAILRLIILEAIIITTLSGYIGLVLGVGISETINYFMSMGATAGGPTIFRNPTVDLDIVIYATLVLITSGVGAGLIPAWKATRVSPIEAMRAE